MNRRIKNYFQLNIVCGYLFALFGNSANAGDISEIKKGGLLSNIPSAVLQLSEWPAAATIRAKQIQVYIPEVAWPTNRCSQWLHKVIDSSWLPTNNPSPLLLREEFDGRDVVRYRWSVNGYTVEVSQTASLFFMRLFSEREQEMGHDPTNRLRIAKELCRQVFARQDERWTGQGNTVIVSNLASLILESSFRVETTVFTNKSGRVVGRPQTMDEEHLYHPVNQSSTEEENAANNSDWYRTTSAWNYWFRNVYWWNDGKNICLFFLKMADGAWVPSYDANNDRHFFSLPTPTVPTHYAPRGKSMEELMGKK